MKPLKSHRLIRIADAFLPATLLIVTLLGAPAILLGVFIILQPGFIVNVFMIFIGAALVVNGLMDLLIVRRIRGALL